MAFKNHDEEHADNAQDEPEDDSSERPAPTSETNPPGFVPPEGAVRARFRRLNRDTGGWEDCQVIVDGIATTTVDAASANPNLPLVEQIPTNYRITWYNTNGRIVGYSKTWTLGSNLNTRGGVSNTPRMWPAGSVGASAMPQGTGYLTPSDTLSLMRGLAMVVHEAAAPMVAQVHMFAEQTLARERAFHEARLRAEQQRHEETLARDRAFMAAMRDVHEKPRDEKIAALTAEVAALRAEEEDDEEEETRQENANPWEVAGKLVEHAPDIIRTVAEEARNFSAKESTNDVPNKVDTDTE